MSWARIVPLLLALALGAAGGWQAGRAPLLLAMAQAEVDKAQESFRAAERHAAVLQAAQARGDALTRRLAMTHKQIDSLEKDRHAALQAHTIGRACLNADAVRVLNDAPTGQPTDLPPAASGTAGAGEPFATDTDVGHWAATARAEYEKCRGRLDALIGWWGASTLN